ncbi:MAG: class I SAM-dependent RNA methyltransferase [Bacilli bacterium]|nr:class I SAM-dependent RNA methyltransferase [Bacilli bacterium]
MVVKITKLNHSGVGMSTINEKVVFIPKTIPGDIVDIEIKKEHKNYIEAIPVTYKELSRNREPIPCPYYQECGGCQLMGLPYQEQLNYKKEKVINILKRYANLTINPKIIASSPYQYRNKITLQVKNGQIGLYTQNSNDLISINNCLLVSDEINSIIKLIEEKLNLQDINQIIIREANNQLMVQFLGNILEEELIKNLSSQVASIYLNEKHIIGQKNITETLDKYQFLISPASFFQVNHNQTINLYNQVKEYLGPNNKKILDLYCGTGTIGIYVSEYCEQVTGIELNPSSVKDAKHNIKLNNLTNIKIKQGDVGKILQAQNTYDAIIVDPPRSGLDKRTRKTLLKIKSPKLIYISCNPITLARDLNELQSLYNLEDITLFDMFPNTYHVECVMWLCLKK